jgi:hypothetical protein
MEAGDLVLGGRDVLDHRAGLLVQRHAVLDELGRAGSQAVRPRSLSADARPVSA